MAPTTPHAPAAETPHVSPLVSPLVSPFVRAITPARASVAVLLRASASLLARASERIDGRTREMPVPGLPQSTSERANAAAGAADTTPPQLANGNEARQSHEFEPGRMTFEFEAIVAGPAAESNVPRGSIELPMMDADVALLTPTGPSPAIDPHQRPSRETPSAPVPTTAPSAPVARATPAVPPVAATPVAATPPAVPPVGATDATPEQPPLVERRSGASPAVPPKFERRASRSEMDAIAGLPLLDTGTDWQVPVPRTTPTSTPTSTPRTTPTSTPRTTPVVAAPLAEPLAEPLAKPLAKPPAPPTPAPPVAPPSRRTTTPTPAPFSLTEASPARRTRPVSEPDIEDWFALEPDDVPVAEPAVEPAPWLAPDVQPRRSRRSARYLLGGLAVALAIFAGSRFLRPSQPVGQPAVRFALRFPDTVAVAQAELSADGSRMVFANTADELFTNRLDQDGIRPLHRNAIDPFFSPDGKDLGFTSTDSAWLRIFVMPVDGGPTRLLADSAMHGSWGDDGQVYVVTAENGVGRVASGGGKAEPLLASNDSIGRIARLVVLPGAKTVLFSYYRGDGEVGAIGALDVQARTWKPLLRSADGLAYDEGYILFTRGNWLMAAPVSADGRTLAGEPRKVIRSGSDGFQFFAQRAQTLVFQPSGTDARSVPVLRDRRGRERVLLNIPAAVALSYPRVSPDGRAIAFTGQRHGAADREVWIYQLPSGPLRALPSEGNEHARSFAPDGKRVLFSSDRGGKGALYVRSWDGSGYAEPALALEGGDPLMGSWLPDGRHFVFGILRPQTQAGDLGIALAGHPESVTMLTKGDFHEWSPTVSPDGQWLAYRSNESGAAQVYVRSLESGTVRQVSQTGGYLPTWARNGREVFFENDGGDTLYVAQLQLGAGVTVTRRAPLWPILPGRGFDVLPGDSEIVTFRAAGVATLPPPPMVVVNFRREIEKAAAP